MSTSLHSLKDIAIIHDTSYYHSNLIKKRKKNQEKVSILLILWNILYSSPIQIEMQTERKRNRGIIMRVHSLRPLKVPSPPPRDRIVKLNEAFLEEQGCSIIRTLYTIVNRSPSCVNMQQGAPVRKNFRHE